MEQKRKKLSGSQYKKKRLKNEEQERKLSNVMKKFLVQKCGLDEPSTSAATDLANNNTVPPQSLPEEVVEESQILTPSDLHEQPGSTSTSTATALDLANKNTVPPQSIPEKIVEEIQKITSSEVFRTFRGSTEHLFQPNNGNFLKLVELLSEFDPVMEEHIRRVQREKIVEITKIAKYFAIIADCSPDVSHYEQLSLTIRVVTFNSIQNKYEIAEFFIGFFEASDSTGEGLAKLILTHLEKLGFELKWLREQGYDNGANMKGVRKGVQNRILEKYPRAFYVPCTCHILNLVVNDAASSTTETTFFFSIVQELYTFFFGSTKRWEVLKKYVSQLTLKPLSATRWASRIDALKPLRFQLCEIYDALILIIEDVNRDAETKVKARGLAKNIKNYKFICGVILWHDILFEINSVSKLLQSVTINISGCIAENLECSTEFPDDTEVRPRRKKRQFDYEKAVDEPLTEEKKFKINFFNYILDITLNSLNERFTLLETHSKKFQFLYDILKLKDIDDKTLENYCSSLELILSVENETDINANDLREELRDVSRMLPYSTKPLDVLFMPK
ncbi:uncharacterized protein LOC136093139 [Hydra vulgaris]|uniref:uncharacterized protein LOC136093139 n=1 Tax=Hydra vulgaris TaxID=6087 RepID=UPI0032E9DED3